MRTHPMPSTRTITVGSILDQRFEIEAVLGRGGFATVYQACQLNMGRSVALKVLDIRPNRSEEEVDRLCERFFQEACNTAAVVHPDIVNVFDYGVTHDGRPYIVLELLKGHTLEEELRTYGAMAPTRALPLFIRCLDALQTTHDKRIVHKDLKPSNLFITNRKSTAETLRLIDFGIATQLDDEEYPTPTGQYVGTAAYCAPEYYEHNLITPALDVYQMGLCLAETLMGGPVVTGPNAIRIIAQHCTGDLKLPWKLLHGPLRTIFQRALANDPKQRYTDAAELRDALSTIDPQQLEPMSIDAIHKRVTLSSLHSPTLISITQDNLAEPTTYSPSSTAKPTLGNTPMTPKTAAQTPLGSTSSQIRPISPGHLTSTPLRPKGCSPPPLPYTPLQHTRPPHACP